MVWDWPTIAKMFFGVASLIAVLLLLAKLLLDRKKRQEEERQRQEAEAESQRREAEAEAERQRLKAEEEAESERRRQEAEAERQRQEADAERQKREAEAAADAERQRIEEVEAKRIRAEEEAREHEVEIQQRMLGVREALKGDPELVKMMLQSAQVHLDPKDVSASAEAVRKIAEKLTPQFIELMKVAASQQIVDIDLRSTEQEVPVNYPTRKMSIEPIDDLGKITELDAAEFIKPDDQFFEDLVTGNMMISRYMTTERDQSLGYVLLDGSGSMGWATRSGMPRHIPARGVTLNLLTRAKKGKSKYFMRIFDASPHDLQMATTSEEAETVMQFVLNQGFTGGDTNIRLAIETAVNDIKTLGGDISKAEIVLISDGEDESIDDIQYMKDLLGDIRLHVCMIAKENPALKAIATSYRVIL